MPKNKGGCPLLLDVAHFLAGLWVGGRAQRTASGHYREFNE
jgi:hypothetical protein